MPYIVVECDIVSQCTNVDTRTQLISLLLLSNDPYPTPLTPPSFLLPPPSFLLLPPSLLLFSPLRSWWMLCKWCWIPLILDLHHPPQLADSLIANCHHGDRQGNYMSDTYFTYLKYFTH